MRTGSEPSFLLLLLIIMKKKNVLSPSAERLALTCSHPVNHLFKFIVLMPRTQNSKLLQSPALAQSSVPLMNLCSHLPIPSSNLA